MTRMDIDGRSIILMGDATTHNGVVIQGSPSCFVDGIPVVRKGDKVYCPKCSPNIFEVTQGLANVTDTEAMLPRAVEGHLSSCGAALIARSAPAAMMQHVLSVINGTNHPTSVTSTGNDQFDQRICLRDQKTAEPIANCFYSLKANGQTIYGRTDVNGLTIKISANEQLDVEIEIIEFDEQ